MEKCAIWKNKQVIGYIKLTEKQVELLNSVKGIDLYFGFDEITNKEHYNK